MSSHIICNDDIRTLYPIVFKCTKKLVRNCTVTIQLKIKTIEISMKLYLFIYFPYELERCGLHEVLVCSKVNRQVPLGE